MKKTLSIYFKYDCLLLIFIGLFAFNNNNILNAATINVNSISGLQAAIITCQTGDIINLAKGHYTNNVINIAKSNITVQAASPGGVFLDGTSTITISGNNNTFGGFQFTANVTANGTNTIAVSGNSNTITQLNFNGYCADHFLYITGQYNMVSYCNFQNKLAVMTAKAGTGDMVQIIPNATNPGYNTIKYCSFQHMPGMGGDYGNECIRIGNSTLATFISRTVIEYCYFEDTGLGDSEAISVKSRENILRYNTMNNNPNAMFCFRNGDNNVAYSNFFINSGGLRAKEANNIFCYNNYFEKSGLNGTMNAVTYIYDTSNSTYVLDNINFLHNTFVDCGMIDFGGIGATNGTWANNIFLKSGNIFQNANNGTTFKNNIYSGFLGIDVSSGITFADPKLALNSDGYYDLTALSPAIGAASNNYPAILNIPGIDTLLLDIKGISRPVSRLLKDVGCEQFSASGVITNKPLKLSDVGPSYLKTLSGTETTKENLNFNVRVNSSSKSLIVNYFLAKPSKINLTIYSLNGTLIKSIDTNNPENKQQTIDISNLQNGMYLVRLTADNYAKTIKFIIKN